MKTGRWVVGCLIVLAAVSTIAIATQVTYVCGNHSPHHAASSIEEAKKLAKENGCTGWDVRGSMSRGEREQALKTLNKALEE